MKKTNLIWMIAMLLFGTLNFTACSDKEDEGSGSTNNEISISNLTGLWQSEYYYYKEIVEGEIIEEGKEKDDEERIQFNTDGTFAWYFYEKDYETGEYDWGRDAYGKWTIEENKIHFFYYQDGGYSDPDVATIENLTSSELTLELYWKGMEKDGKLYEIWEEFSFKKIGQ